MRWEHPQKVLEMHPMRRYGVALVARSRQGHGLPKRSSVVRRCEFPIGYATYRTNSYNLLAFLGLDAPAGAARTLGFGPAQPYGQACDHILDEEGGHR
jgi:hypothetical protein